MYAVRFLDCTRNDKENKHLNNKLNFSSVFHSKRYKTTSNTPTVSQIRPYYKQILPFASQPLQTPTKFLPKSFQSRTKFECLETNKRRIWNDFGSNNYTDILLTSILFSKQTDNLTTPHLSEIYPDPHPTTHPICTPRLTANATNFPPASNFNAFSYAG